jgi:hypothetical protein
MCWRSQSCARGRRPHLDAQIRGDAARGGGERVGLVVRLSGLACLVPFLFCGIPFSFRCTGDSIISIPATGCHSCLCAVLAVYLCITAGAHDFEISRRSLRGPARPIIRSAKRLGCCQSRSGDGERLASPACRRLRGWRLQSHWVFG